MSRWWVEVRHHHPPIGYDIEGVKLKHNHIYPVNDLIEHNTGIVGDEYSCQCNPEFEYNFNENFCIVKHDAMDRRNLYE